MPVFGSSGQLSAVTTAYKTAIAILAGATPRRGKIFDMNFSAGGSPNSTDCAIQFDLSRVATTAGTSGSAVTPVQTDFADVAFTGTVGQNYSAEPGTTTTGIFNIALNQRAPFRWQTYLGSGAELLYPATQTSGFAFRVLSTGGYANNAGGVIYHME